MGDWIESFIEVKWEGFYKSCVLVKLFKLKMLVFNKGYSCVVFFFICELVRFNCWFEDRRYFLFVNEMFKNFYYDVG